MKLAVTAFLNYASSTSLPNRDKAAILVFSRLIAYQLSIPSSPVESANEHYVNTHNAQVDAVVSELNENIVIDVPFLREVIRKVWLARYELVYSPMSKNAHLMVGAILSFDDNAFSAELRAVDTTLSADGTLGRIVSVCLDALKVQAPVITNQTAVIA